MEVRGSAIQLLHQEGFCVICFEEIAPGAVALSKVDRGQEVIGHSGGNHLRDDCFVAPVVEKYGEGQYFDTTVTCGTRVDDSVQVHFVFGV